jgi:hypothetical protein
MPRPLHYTRHGIGPSPQRALWAAVLELALLDCFARRVVAKPNCGTTSVSDQVEARRFLFDKTGPNATWRRDVCWMADIDPDALEERLKMMGGVDVTS